MLEIKDLTINYGNHQVLSNVDMIFKKSHVYGLIGINGCGKTSVLNAVAKFIDYTGNIEIDNISTKKLGRRQLSKKVSYMRQNINLNFSYSVEEIVNMSQYSNGFNSVDKNYIYEIMSVCELENIKSKNILEVSGGQRQRVFFAKTLAQDSEIIMIDEGFANIDIYYQLKFMNYLQKLSIEKNKIIIIVIHDINFTLKAIDEVVVFKDSNIYDYGKTNDVIDKKMMQDVFNVDLDITNNGIEFKHINGDKK